jgi:hypothetical protein
LLVSQQLLSNGDEAPLACHVPLGVDRVQNTCTWLTLLVHVCWTCRWPVFRDRRPELYAPLVTLDGKNRHPGMH